MLILLTFGALCRAVAAVPSSRGSLPVCHLLGTVGGPVSGRFVIRTRAGVTYTSHPKRVTESLPVPELAAHPRPLPDDGWSDDRTDTHDDIDPDWSRKLTQKTRPTATVPTRSCYDDEPPL
ncbi:hypothetical protein [Actinomycetospora sp. NBC_00405]|uniref:hypothetical protein n=1 Tax=Actinomycetospora sp. NBC_00405 TaxID=2975952 RepID=UPI002E1C1ED6